MVVTTIAASINAVKATFELVKSAVGKRDSVLIEQASVELSAKLIDLHQVCAALNDRNLLLTKQHAALEERVLKAEDRKRVFETYAPYKTIKGGWILRKIAALPGQEAPDLCPDCVENGVKTYLQPTFDGARHFLYCKLAHGKFPGDQEDAEFKPLPEPRPPFY